MTKVDFTGKRRKRLNVFECNFCKKTFEKKWGREYNFCSKSCIGKSCDNAKLTAAKIRSITADPEKHRQRAIDAAARPEVFAKNLLTLSRIHSDPVLMKRQKAGTARALKRPEVRAKLSQSQLIAQNKPETNAKRHLTAKANGSYGKSKAEDGFAIWLQSLYCCERQKIVNGWAIDFYLTDLDIYIQFDGVYWHGLIPFNTLTKQGKYITKVKARDEEQKEWFAKRDMRLVRITDKQFAAMDHMEKDKWNSENLAIFTPASSELGFCWV
jgi:hypothetical protein